MRPNDIILQADDKQWLHLLRQLFDGFSIDMFSSKRGGCFFCFFSQESLHGHDVSL